MRQIKLLIVFLILTIMANGQIANGFLTRYKVKKVILKLNSYGPFEMTGAAIDTYNEKGLVILHEQIGDTSKLGKQTFLYQYDYRGKVKNKVSILANGEVNEVSVYYTDDLYREPYYDKSIRELKIHFINNNIDTIFYNENNNIISVNRFEQIDTYEYNDRQDLIAINYMERREKKVQTIIFTPKYDKNGLLTEVSYTDQKDIIEYDNLKRPVKLITMSKERITAECELFYED